MNIFYVDQCPVISACSLCDRHVVKMILETAQLLCTAHHVTHGSDDIPYRKTHVNHPSAVWARASVANYLWLVEHGLAMCAEYTRRYGKRHKTQDVLEWCDQHIPLLSSDGFTHPPQCMPDEFKHADTVVAYRNYYNHKSTVIDMRYAYSSVPSWLTIAEAA